MRSVTVMGVMAQLARHRFAVRERQQRSRGNRGGAGDRCLRPPDSGARVGNLCLGALGKNRRQGDAEGDENRFAFHAEGTLNVPIADCQYLYLCLTITHFVSTL